MSFVERPANLLPCPRCGQLTDSLKHYRFMHLLVFFLVAAYHQQATYVACPKCMRGTVGLRMLINLVPANVLWPILVLPWGLVLLGMSCTKGHSAALRKSIE
jgi:hypothetical protein